MRWTVEEVARVLSVAPPVALDRLTRLAGFSIDSRTIGAGELYVAIHGLRHDGHAFVESALARGALAAVVDPRRLAEYPEGIRGKLLPAEDTLAALQRLAQAVRRRWGRRLAGGAGSIGKTTTKEILAALLAARFRVLKSEGNLNNEYGVPLTLLRLEDAHEAALIEVGVEDRGAEGTAFDFVWPAGRARLALPLVSRHNVTNALAALAAASIWGVGAAEAAHVFPRLAPPAMRGEVLRFNAGFTVLNDCYNSSPTALASMIHWLAATPGYRRRILGAGEMLELGSASPELHREAGRVAAADGRIDWIFGVQGEAASLLRGAVEAGYPRTRQRIFASSGEAAQILADFVTPGALLLVKGSRGGHMERIVEALKSGHAPAATLADAGATGPAPKECG